MKNGFIVEKFWVIKSPFNALYGFYEPDREETYSLSLPFQNGTGFFHGRTNWLTTKYTQIKMDRNQLDKESRWTKNVNGTWKWIILVGVGLFLIAILGSKIFGDAEPPGAKQGDVAADTIAGDSRQ